MDKLVKGYLEAVIEKEIYLRKKDQLLKQKSDLKLKHSDFNKDEAIDGCSNLFRAKPSDLNTTHII